MEEEEEAAKLAEDSKKSDDKTIDDTGFKGSTATTIAKWNIIN